MVDAQGFKPLSYKAETHLKRLKEKIRTECPLLSKRVMISGTGCGSDLNGRVGVAESFDEANGRYVVRLGGPGAGARAGAGAGESTVGIRQGSLESA